MCRLGAGGLARWVGPLAQKPKGEMLLELFHVVSSHHLPCCFHAYLGSSIPRGEWTAHLLLRSCAPHFPFDHQNERAQVDMPDPRTRLRRCEGCTLSIEVIASDPMQQHYLSSASSAHQPGLCGNFVRATMCRTTIHSRDRAALQRPESSFCPQVTGTLAVAFVLGWSSFVFLTATNSGELCGFASKHS